MQKELSLVDLPREIIHIILHLLSHQDINNFLLVFKEASALISETFSNPKLAEAAVFSVLDEIYDNDWANTLTQKGNHIENIYPLYQAAVIFAKRITHKYALANKLLIPFLHTQEISRLLLNISQRLSPQVDLDLLPESLSYAANLYDSNKNTFTILNLLENLLILKENIKDNLIFINFEKLTENGNFGDLIRDILSETSNISWPALDSDIENLANLILTTDKSKSFSIDNARILATHILKNNWRMELSDTQKKLALPINLQYSTSLHQLIEKLTIESLANNLNLLQKYSILPNEVKLKFSPLISSLKLSDLTNRLLKYDLMLEYIFSAPEVSFNLKNKNFSWLIETYQQQTFNELERLKLKTVNYDFFNYLNQVDREIFNNEKSPSLIEAWSSILYEKFSLNRINGFEMTNSNFSLLTCFLKSDCTKEFKTLVNMQIPYKKVLSILCHFQKNIDLELLTTRLNQYPIFGPYISFQTVDFILSTSELYLGKAAFFLSQNPKKTTIEAVTFVFKLHELEEQYQYVNFSEKIWNKFNLSEIRQLFKLKNFFTHLSKSDFTESYWFKKLPGSHIMQAPEALTVLNKYNETIQAQVLQELTMKYRNRLFNINPDEIDNLAKAIRSKQSSFVQITLQNAPSKREIIIQNIICLTAELNEILVGNTTDIKDNERIMPPRKKHKTTNNEKITEDNTALNFTF